MILTIDGYDANLIEHGQQVIRLALGVEGDDVLHDVSVVPPVQSLEVISGQDVDLSLARHVCEEDDLVGVAGFQESLHGLEPVARLGPLLSGQVVVALLVGNLGNLVQDSELLVVVDVGCAQFLGHVLAHLDVVLQAKLESFQGLLAGHVQIDRLKTNLGSNLAILIKYLISPK